MAELATSGARGDPLKYGGYRQVNADEPHTAQVVATHAAELAQARLTKDPDAAAHVQEMRDSNQRKLEAESTVGVLAALVAGFALSMIPAYTSIADPAEECRCALLGAESMASVIVICEYVHVLGLGAVAALAAYSVVFTTGFNFIGTKILSQRKATLDQKVATFNAWFDSPKGRERQRSRTAFAVSLPMFLISISVTPKVVCADCVLALLLCALMICVGVLLFKVAREMLGIKIS